MTFFYSNRITNLLTLATFLTVSIFLAATAHTQGISAHRGEHLESPENTLPAIKAAIDAGAQQVEIDVKSTRDKILLLMHDWTVDRTTDGSGKVADLSYDEIKLLDAGSWFSQDHRNVRVPTFRETLTIIPHKTIVNVHVHGGTATVVSAAKTIKEMDRLDHCFITLDMDAFDEMAAARQAVPYIKLCKGHPAGSAITRNDIMIPEKAFYGTGFVSPGKIDTRKINYIQLFGAPASQAQLIQSVKTLHEYEVIVNFCCANTAEQMRPLLEADVDYILTDNIHIGLKLLKEYSIGLDRKE